MSETAQQAKDIFLDALNHDEGASRDQFLDLACGEDSELRRRVERLIAAHELPDSILDRTEPLPKEQSLEHAGQMIGRYKILQKIGEGGMGTVYMAEQTRPVTRRVALKLIKSGMDTQSVIARFEAERQALAMMDHPNIAKVLDAGTTETGRPYFVMELVKGVPITQYCDEHKLTIRKRLELFTQVCQAVQHAHQKGIIHRDLKPSNVLVAQYDGKPVPKVIDFGVAKAISQRLTEKTMFTEFGQIVGTLEYMSPEQAQFNQLDVDTRSDIYSLGVLLYELLTGETPFDGKRLRSSAFEEVLRILREEEPPKPSNRISTLGERATKVSESRAIEVSRLGAAVRGDLDWIVMKALDKSRARRYETASNFADDVARYLKNEAVLARSPSPVYIARKFVRRNRVSVLVGVFAAVLLLAFAVHDAHRRSIITAMLNNFTAHMFERCMERALLGDEAANTLAQDLRELRGGGPNLESDTVEAVTLFFSGDMKASLTKFNTVHQGSPENTIALCMISIIHGYNGNYHESELFGNLARAAGKKKTSDRYDQLFLGYLDFYNDYDAGIKTFEELLEERPDWIMARALYAAILTHKSYDVAAIEEARVLLDDAANEIAVCEKIAPNNPFVLTISLFTHTTALNLSDESSRPELQSRCSTAFAAIGEVGSYPLGEVLRGEFHFHAGRIDESINEFRKSETFPDTLATLLYGRGQVKSARRVFSDRVIHLSNHPSYWISHSVLCMDDPSLRKQLKGHIAKWDESGQPWFNCDPNVIWPQVRALQIALLLQEPELAARKADQLLRSSPNHARYSMYTPTRPLVMYVAGKIDDGDLLREVGGSREAEQNARYWIALKKLAEGNEAEFLDALDRCRKSQYEAIIGPSLSAWALERRIQEIRDWPEWAE